MEWVIISYTKQTFNIQTTQYKYSIFEEEQKLLQQ